MGVAVVAGLPAEHEEAPCQLARSTSETLMGVSGRYSHVDRLRIASVSPTASIRSWERRRRGRGPCAIQRIATIRFSGAPKSKAQCHSANFCIK